MQRLKIVLDTNEFILAFGAPKELLAERVLSYIAQTPKLCELDIVRTIVIETIRNISVSQKKHFFAYIRNHAKLTEDYEVPVEFGIKYASKGLKRADAFIAGYAEYIGADILVTENRHFLRKHSNLPFKILTAKEFIKYIGKSTP